MGQNQVDTPICLNNRATIDPYYAAILVGPLPINHNANWEPLAFPYTRKARWRVCNPEPDGETVYSEWLFEISASISDTTLPSLGTAHLTAKNSTNGPRRALGEYVGRGDAQVQPDYQVGLIETLAVEELFKVDRWIMDVLAVVWVSGNEDELWSYKGDVIVRKFPLDPNDPFYGTDE
ncbi:uncharacterized protein BJX67DRAFT_376341 [Aspergillus lucknowensis]|uniref:Uncharacterized protein n=1 Tax=Aspergillus lucknowensis TaxID=176173 RepID=A0ABR4M7E7_9EURO